MQDELRKDEQEQESLEISRGDFLKSVGVAGLGLAGLSAMLGGQAFSEIEKKEKYIIVITNGGNDPNRAIFALLMAEVVANKEWGKLHVWMTLEGADLANRKKADKIESPIFKKFGNAQDLMKKVKDKGAWFGVCPPCAEYAGAVGDDKYEFVEKAAGDWLMKNIQDAWVLWM